MVDIDREDIDYSLLESTVKPERPKLKGPVGTWIECYLAQTPPTFEDCRDYFAGKGLTITKRDYESACKKMHKEPR